MVGGESKEDGNTGTGGSDDALGDAVLDDEEGGELETLVVPLPCSVEICLTYIAISFDSPYSAR